VREKYEATKVLEVGDKVKKLGRTHKWLLSLASRSSEMHEQLKHDISAIEHEIRVAKESARSIMLICSAISSMLLLIIPSESPCALITILISPFGIRSNLSPYTTL
jgi:hypothetical protein